MSPKNSTLTFIPRLIYNRTVRAIETFRHRDDINLVELVTRHEEIEARFERRRTFLPRPGLSIVVSFFF